MLTAKEFKKVGRNFHLVLNKKSLPHLGDAIKYLKTDKCRYLLCRKGLNKKGEEHAHIYVNYSAPRQVSSKNTFGAHIAKCRGTPKQNVAYINDHHPDLVEEFGRMPKEQADAWQEFTDDIKRGEVDKFSKMYARYEGYAVRRLMEIAEQDDVEYERDLRDKNCILYGPRHTYKSTAAKYLNHPKRYYQKFANKWFDGYKGERTIIIEELTPAKAQMLTDYIKVWSDKWGFPAEGKGSHFWIRSGVELIITSNYSPEQLFGNSEDFEPILRRFTILHCTKEKVIDETDYEDYKE